MSSTPYESLPLHGDSFVFGDVENLMDGLGQGSELGKIDVDVAPAGQDAPRQEDSPPFYIPEEDLTPHFVGEVGNWVLPQPRSEEEYYDSPFEPSTSYEHQEDFSSFRTSPSTLPCSQADLPYPSMPPSSPAHLFSSTLTDSPGPFLPPAVPAARFPYSADLPSAFTQLLPYSPSFLPSADLPHPPSHNTPPYNVQATPRMSSADSPASSDVSSGATSSIASSGSSSRSSARLRVPLLEYIPSIRYTIARRNSGVLCAQTYICRWGNCGTEIQLERNDNTAEFAFHRAVEKHIDEHASPCEFDGRRVCRWDHGKCTTTGKHKDKRSMDRHIKTHIPWRYYCQHCGGTYGRERQRHLRVCGAYRRKKAAGEVSE